MYKNVQVNHYNNANNTTTTPFSSSPSQVNQTATTLPVQITGTSSSSSTLDTRPSFLPTSNIGVSRISDGGVSLPVSFNPSMSHSQSTKLKSDVDQLDDLVKDLLIEVNRPLSSNTVHRNGSNNNPNKHSTSSSSYSYHRRSNNNDNNNEISTSKLPSSLRASSYTQASTLNNQKRNDFDANSMSGLIDGSSLSSNGVHREEQRSKSTREERIRIKRGGGSGGTDIPITNSSSMTTTTTTTNKPAQTTSSRDQLSIDEQLIDSLLESVQNTLKKRSQHSHQTGWTTDIPIRHQHPVNNRRTYSSSAAYTDSVHRVSKVNIEIIVCHTLICF